jgi:hypothetical protein
MYLMNLSIARLHAPREASGLESSSRPNDVKYMYYYYLQDLGIYTNITSMVLLLSTAISQPRIGKISKFGPDTKSKLYQAKTTEGLINYCQVQKWTIIYIHVCYLQPIPFTLV